MNRLECYQAASVAMDTWLCNGKAGRGKLDPVYRLVLENRDKKGDWSGYSSCGDRAHFKLWRFGCRKAFVNREERTPLPNDFKWGMNIAFLHDLSKGSPCMTTITSKGKKIAAPPPATWVPMVGDELIIWNDTKMGKDAHSLSLVALNGTEALTANYGAGGMTDVEFPGGKLAEGTLEVRNGIWWYGDKNPKRVQRVLRIEDYIETLTAKANLEGVPFDAAYIGETRDLIENERAA